VSATAIPGTAMVATDMATADTGTAAIHMAVAITAIVTTVTMGIGTMAARIMTTTVTGPGVMMGTAAGVVARPATGTMSIVITMVAIATAGRHGRRESEIRLSTGDAWRNQGSIESRV